LKTWTDSIINNLNNKRFKIPTAKTSQDQRQKKTTRLLSVQPFGEARTGTPITSRKIKQQMQEELS
jgi:hypothetical protein